MGRRKPVFWDTLCCETVRDQKNCLKSVISSQVQGFKKKIATELLQRQRQSHFFKKLVDYYANNFIKKVTSELAL